MPPGDPARFPDDELNPYAPPRSDMKLEPESFDLMPVRFSIDDIFARSWEIYRARFGLCIGVVSVWLAVFVGLYIGAFLSMAAAQNANDAAVVIVGVVGYLTLMLLLFCISVGLLRVILDIARGREATIGGLFRGGRFIWRIFLAGILAMLAMYGAMLIGVIAGVVLAGVVMSAFHASPVLGGFLAFLGIIPGVIGGYIVWLRLSQFLFLIVDRDLGVIESLRVSYRITRGNAGLLFVIALATGLINFVGMIACGVGIFFTTPYLALLNVVAYLALMGQAAADPYTKGDRLAELDPL